MAEAAATVAVLVLAAGRSSRTAPAHKLLAPDATGQTMLARTVHTALLSRAAHIIVVVPPNQPDLHQLVQTALPTDPRLHSCTAHNAAQGLSASLKAGVAYAENLDAPAVLVCLGDMPLVSATLMNALIATQALVPPPPAAAPELAGRPGNPVIWHHSQFAALKAVEGDKGGRAILAALGAAVLRVPANPAELVDFDTPERLADFARLTKAPIDQEPSALKSSTRAG